MDVSRVVRRVFTVLACLLLLGAVAGSIAGCSKDTGSEPYDEAGGIPDDPEAGGDTGGDTDATDATSESVSDADQIPAGREIAEGGGGPVQYTFREEWRRALPEAQAWRPGAYLISAVGDYINDDGVPSEWRFSFIDSDQPDALLFVYIDPWGNVTNTEEKTGDAVTSNVSKYDKPMLYDVIDSDEAVTIAKETLGSRYDLADTKDPRISLGWSVLDGSGPYWEYNLFYQPTAEYISAQIDAKTGEVTLQE